MASIPDLSPCTYFGFDPGDTLLAIGWLERGDEFATGRMDDRVYRRLGELARQPWEFFIYRGFHSCSLCQYDGAESTANLFIPGDGVIYACPELIVHCIDAHWYRPPEQFQAAVVRCADQNSMEFKRRFLEHGGRRVLEAVNQLTAGLERKE